MEITRFGPGYRRPGGPHGAAGLSDAVVWSDPRARVTEVAFAARALLPLQTSPETALFIVVSGGGWVQVGGERAAVNHGEAVVWPAGLAHAAWTDGSPMRALVVEVADDPASAERTGPADSTGGRHAPPQSGRPDGPGAPERGRAATPVTPGRGALADRPPSRLDHDRSQGEPW